MSKLSIVLPCLNEADAIPVVIPKTIALLTARAKELNKNFNESFEVIVVNDGSTDRSAELLAAQPSIKVVNLPKQVGYGYALKQGFAQSTGDLLAFYDLDGTCSVKDILNLADHLQKQDLDVVWGLRLHEKTKMPLVRQIGNQLYSFLLRRIYPQPIHDSCSGMRVFRSEHKNWMNGLPNGLDFSIAMTVKCLKNNLRFAEVPISYESRLGDSKLKASVHGFTFLKTLLVFAFRT